MINRLIAILFISFVFLSSAVFFVIALLIWLFTVLFDKRLWLLHRFTCYWAALYLWMFPPWRITVEGRELIDPKQTYVIVSNHQSLVDILVAFLLFTHFKWVSKAEVFQVPLIGWNMYLNQYVRLERGRKRSIRKMYAACERHLKHGSSVFLFPEGTRSTTGKMREFKEGAFVLAKRHQIPVLPLVINGSKNAVPKNSLNFHGGSDVNLKVLPPVHPDEFAGLTTQELAENIRERIRAHVIEEAKPE
ncbi:MAG: 1-acyl-sn-glycerol-3-phosphate acyltransferase [Pseudomonadales bacterium]|nr:1-acyl-sn-glycerol-3-phosphate acyltransferase [Pseudomonadales bacterium]